MKRISLVFSSFQSKQSRNRLKNLLQNRSVPHYNRLISAVATLLIAFCILATCVKSYAQAIPRSAYVAHICPGSKLGIRNFLSQQSEGVPLGEPIRSGRNALIVKAREMAYIRFKDAAGRPINNKFVQVGPHLRRTYYSFPCTISGYSNFALTWEYGNTISCKNAVAENQLKPCPRR